MSSQPTGDAKRHLDRFLDERQLTPATLERLGVYPDERGRLEIPLHDEQGQLQGWLYRATDPDAPRRFSAARETRTSTIVYNLHRVLQTEGRYLWVVEGVADVWALQAAGVDDAVSLMGPYSSPRSQQKVRRLAELAAEQGRELVVWVGQERDYYGLHLLLSELHRLPRPTRVRGWSSAAEPLGGQWGTPAEIVGRLGPGAVARVLAAAPPADGLVLQLRNIFVELKEAPVATRLRRLQDILARLPYRPADLDLLEHELRRRDDELYEAVREAPESQGGIEGFFQANLSGRAGGSLERETLDWAREHGSTVVRHALARGYDVLPLALNERAEGDLGRGAYVDALPRAERRLDWGRRNHPSRRALERELQLLGTGLDPQTVEIVWVNEGPEGCPQGEALLVRGYLDRYDVYLPTAQAAQAPGAALSSSHV